MLKNNLIPIVYYRKNIFEFTIYDQKSQGFFCGKKTGLMLVFLCTKKSFSDVVWQIKFIHIQSKNPLPTQFF